MNERIKELEKQSIFYNEDEETWEFDRNKFAELIVRECADICAARKLTPAEFVASELREYFGVER